MKLSEFINELYFVYNRVIQAFIANQRYNTMKTYRSLIASINDYLASIEQKINGKDLNMLMSQHPEIIAEFNEMVDWVTSLNSGFQDVAKYKIKQ